MVQLPIRSIAYVDSVYMYYYISLIDTIVFIHNRNCLLSITEFSKCRSSVDNDIGLDGYSETDSVLHQNLVSHHL